MAEQSIVPRLPKKMKTLIHCPSCQSEDLPADTWSLILNHLFLGDRLIFKAVCKYWNSIDLLRLLYPPPVHSPNFDSPCLMFSRRSSEKVVTWKVFRSLYNDSYHVDFPELLGAKIRYSKCGWFLASRGENNGNFFFNPSTRVKIELPLTKDSFLQMCFTSAPTSANDCVVFGIFSSSGVKFAELGIIKLGEQKWTVHRCSNKLYDFMSTNCSPVFCNGCFYCLDRFGNLSVFNPDNEECHWTQYEKCHSETITLEVLHQSYMAEVDGDIWAVFVTHNNRRVGVYKLDLKEFVWNPLQSLDNKCLYVSPGVSFAETCAVKSLANKVYFDKFQGENGVIYSLASEMYYSVGGGFACKEGYNPLGPNHSIWFKL